MYKKVLIACDASEGSNIALVHAAILARKLDAGLSAVWVRGSLPHYPETVDEIDEEEESARDFFENIKTQLASVAAAQGVAIQPEMRSGNPAKQIIDYARERNIDLIVLGSRGHSRLWGELLGHTADRVSEQAPCSVLIVRSEKEEARYRKMLVGYDRSPSAEFMLRGALVLAKQLGSEVHVIWVHEVPAVLPEGAGGAVDEDWTRNLFSTAIKPRIESVAREVGVPVKANYRLGNAAHALVREAEAGGFRLIAVGHRGHSGLWGRLLGGTAARASHHAHCDVLIVREKEGHSV